MLPFVLLAACQNESAIPKGGTVNCSDQVRLFFQSIFQLLAFWTSIIIGLKSYPSPSLTTIVFNNLVALDTVQSRTKSKRVLPSHIPNMNYNSLYKDTLTF